MSATLSLIVYAEWILRVAKIPAKNEIPAGTGTGTKSPNPGRDPGGALPGGDERSVPAWSLIAEWSHCQEDRTGQEAIALYWWIKVGRGSGEKVIFVEVEQERLMKKDDQMSGEQARENGKDSEYDTATKKANERTSNYYYPIY